MIDKRRKLAAVKKYLAEKGEPMTETMELLLNTVFRMEADAYQKGFSEGLSEGITIGYDEGFKAGKESMEDDEA